MNYFETIGIDGKFVDTINKQFLIGLDEELITVNCNKNDAFVLDMLGDVFATNVNNANDILNKHNLYNKQEVKITSNDKKLFDFYMNLCKEDKIDARKSVKNCIGKKAIIFNASYLKHPDNDELIECFDMEDEDKNWYFLTRELFEII